MTKYYLITETNKSYLLESNDNEEIFKTCFKAYREGAEWIVLSNNLEDLDSEEEYRSLRSESYSRHHFMNLESIFKAGIAQQSFGLSGFYMDDQWSLSEKYQTFSELPLF